MKSCRMLFVTLGWALLIFAGTAKLRAQEAANPAPKADAPAARSDFALTIYSSADPGSFDPKQFSQNRGQPVPGYGVVRETRKIALNEGENTVRFTDVASGIDPTTVAFKSLTLPGSTAVLEQDYAFDLVSSEKILEKFLGEQISVKVKGQPGNDISTLLSAEPGMLIVQDRAGGALRMIPRGQDLAEIALPKLPEGLITKPTLIWKVATNKTGEQDVQVSYQTDGLTWRADYNLVLSGESSKADLGAWVSILNQSGATYPNARLKLVAGDVQRVQPPRVITYSGMRAEMGMDKRSAPQFEEKAFFEYHLYTLARKTSLADRSTKQIELFPAKVGVPVAKTYVYYGLPVDFRGFIPPAPNPDRNLGTQSNKKVDIYLSVKNTEANGLGLPLPAGRVRVYQRDEADAALEFVGEDTIGHTSKGEEVLVKLGSAFDVVGERKQTNFVANVNGRVITESFEISVRNHKAEPIKVIVKENLFRWANWAITASSDPYEKEDSRTIHFPVEVKADGEKKLTYTVRYSW